MEHFKWLLRTKLIMRIIELLSVKIFHCHSIWRSISDMLFKALNVANSKNPRFLLPLLLTSNLRAFVLAVSSAWNALFSALCMAGFSLLLKSAGTSERFSLRVLFKECLLFHPVILHSSCCSVLFSSESYVTIWNVYGLNNPIGLHTPWGQLSYYTSSHTRPLCPKT